ncbi:type IV secretion system protein VirB3 [Ochrobactrum sp. 695/2009]|nr:type IV secretion system protein VirB3 [Ochrobactrum sp. 721/2009]PJT15745.1 type IV secretion system protein VirB3 [Ochrobactrum sp. 720/2009]PJT23893.1 type IV secretion system protein VirB3 [Ochrobactrum sp. 715/2009]PJT24037.1 type IV secretion system protein VirB3 [Ochrobactrum sp. 695/2009]PJT33568.1 type IV secretion system protein VirB3 [Ochrobactrum sp. 689/2009]
MSGMIDLEEDTLFLACTRPAMIGGVTMEAMGVNMILTTILFIVAGSIAYVLVGLAFHVAFKAIVKHDHNMFRILLGWIETRGRARNAGFWGGSSLTPMKLVRRYDERDLGFV